MCSTPVDAPRKVGHHGGLSVSCRGRRVVGLCERFQATHYTNAAFSGTCVITPKGLRELFILRVVPAVKFDWLAHKGGAAIVHSLSFESPSSVLQKKWVIWRGRAGGGGFGRSRVGHAALVSSPAMKAEKIAYRPCDTRRCNGAWSGAQCRWWVKQHWVRWARKNGIFSSWFKKNCLHLDVLFFFCFEMNRPLNLSYCFSFWSWIKQNFGWNICRTAAIDRLPLESEDSRVTLRWSWITVVPSAEYLTPILPSYELNSYLLVLETCKGPSQRGARMQLLHRRTRRRRRSEWAFLLNMTKQRKLIHEYKAFLLL